MKKIDLRSDTVTKPTQAMRQAMYEAEVGDDVFGDDPTVNRLEEVAAERCGKESSLFVPSGSMANFLSLLTHCQRGDEVILGDDSHIFVHEQGSTAALGGIHARPVKNTEDGRLLIADIKRAINPDDIHRARTRVIALENTWHGSILRPDYLGQVASVASEHSLKMHLDGARIFNAAVALDIPVAKLTKDFDSVQFCFSKGLSCPVGSIICGNKAFIKQARRNRKLVGGAMRQVGILAAACLVALDQMIERLAEDHQNAQKLAQGLADIAGLEVSPESTETNIVLAGVSKPGLSATALVERLEKDGILVLTFDENRIRAVTHYGITEKDILETIDAFKQALSE
jgi:threonine aldolase